MVIDIDEFDDVGGDGVLELVLVDGPQDIAQFPALQHLDEGDEPKAVARVAAQVLDAQACLKNN